MSDQDKTPPPQPITRAELDTTIRVLQTVDKFQEAMQSAGGLRGGVYFSSEYKSSLTPAAEAVATFRDWFNHFAPEPTTPTNTH